MAYINREYHPSFHEQLIRHLAMDIYCIIVHLFCSFLYLLLFFFDHPATNLFVYLFIQLYICFFCNYTFIKLLIYYVLTLYLFSKYMNSGSLSLQ